MIKPILAQQAVISFTDAAPIEGIQAKKTLRLQFPNLREQEKYVLSLAVRRVKWLDRINPFLRFWYIPITIKTGENKTETFLLNIHSAVKRVSHLVEEQKDLQEKIGKNFQAGVRKSKGAALFFALDQIGKHYISQAIRRSENDLLTPDVAERATEFHLRHKNQVFEGIELQVFVPQTKKQLVYKKEGEALHLQVKENEKETPWININQ